MDARLGRLLESYRELARLEQQPRHSSRAWNAAADRLSDALPSVLADPDLLQALREVGRSDPDPFVRRYAATDADPPAPSSPDEVRDWLAHPAVGLAVLAEQARPARVLVELAQDLEPLTYEEGEDVSWLGGPPLGPLPEWPRRADGIPLVHVAQVDLRPGRWMDPQGPLPDAGVLQVFHDLETSGLDPSDGSASAWLVRWVQVPGELVAPPVDAHGPGRRWALVAQEPGVSLPSPDDLDDDALAERCEAARLSLIATRLLLEGSAREQHLRPLSSLLGHGWESEREGRQRLVAAAGGKEEDWALLADLSGTGALDTWFGDEGHLELWIRRTDLEQRAFDRVWALLR